MKTNQPKATPVVVSHTTPRKRNGNQPRLAPKAIATLSPGSVDQIELNFVARVELLENGCWLWHGTFDKPRPRQPKRVPTFWRGTNRANGKIIRAYAYAYEKRIGELPDPKKFAFRLECGNDLCVNPTHYRIEPRRTMTMRESLPNARQALLSNPMCLNGLHERTPENTITFTYKGEPQSRCHPCMKATQRRKHHRNKAK